MSKCEVICVQNERTQCVHPQSSDALKKKKGGIRFKMIFQVTSSIVTEHTRVYTDFF